MAIKQGKSPFEPLAGRGPSPGVTEAAKESLRRTEYRGFSRYRALAEYLHDLEGITATENELSQGFTGRRWFSFRAQMRIAECLGLSHTDTFPPGYDERRGS